MKDLTMYKGSIILIEIYIFYEIKKLFFFFTRTSSFQFHTIVFIFIIKRFYTLN